MINKVNPRLIMIIGVLLMILGCVLPLLMVAKVLESTFFLNFTAYIFQVMGLILGVIGVAYIVRLRKK
jgi:hypothetical protein